MKKQEFLIELRSGLNGLPQEDIEERIGFYSEMIDDRVEEGLSEEEAIKEVGSVEDVISQIVAETPLTKIVKEKVKPKRSLKAWEIVLLILTSPIWLSLLIAAVSVVLSLYITLWSLIISLWAIELSFAVCAIVLTPGSAVFFVQGDVSTGLVSLGTGLLFAGLTIFLFFGCKAATKGIILLTKKIALGIKSLFIGKDGKNEKNS